MTDVETPGMVIVGAGECGARAAASLREQGYLGSVTLIGEEFHAPYERPPLSKAALAEGALRPTAIHTPEALAALDIRWLGGVKAIAINRAHRRVTLADAREIRYDRLLLATGATPRALPLAAGDRRTHYLRTFDDAKALAARARPSARVVVLGGGFIGLEIAASLRQRGCSVTVVEPQPRILMRGTPPAIAEAVRAAHEAHGVTIITGVVPEALTDRGDASALTLADGRAIEADLVVVGVGAIPDGELAAAAGLEFDNGIAVDAALRTSDPSVFAAGDCCSFPSALYGGRRIRIESWRNAQQQGDLAARNMLGAGEPFTSVPWLWSDQFELTLQVAGLPDVGCDTVRRDLGDAGFILFHIAHDGRLVAASGIGVGNAIARDIRLAEMLIARRAAPPAKDLASPGVKLKALLS